MTGRAIHSDETLLEICDRTAAGESSHEIGRDLGIKATQVRTIRQRITKAADAIPCDCIRPENQDGGMPAGWWRR